MARARTWCFTSYQEDLNFDHESDELRYCVYQREKCPETEREHWQGYVEFKKPLRFRAVKQFFNDRELHVEARRGTRDQARAYCKKDDTRVEGGGPFEIGEWGQSRGRRSDLIEIVDRLKEDPMQLGDLAVQFPGSYCNARGGLRDIRAHLIYKKAKQFRHVQTLVLWGQGGVGKTRWAMSRFPDAYRITQPDSQLWWDGYNGESTIVLDDFYGWIKWGMFLVMLDGYSVRLGIKGGHTWACWNRVIITSNSIPDDWYEKHTLADYQFDRRLHCIVNMTGPNEFDIMKGDFDDWLSAAATQEEGTPEDEVAGILSDFSDFE